MPRRKKTPTAPESASGEAVTSLKYPATRKNIPPAGLEAQGFVKEEAAVYYRHDPHLPPVLRSSPDPAATDRLQELLATARQRALSGEEAGILAAALERYEPWLEWSGKRERPWFEVDPVALHMHERVSTQAVLRVLAATKDTRGQDSDRLLEGIARENRRALGPWGRWGLEGRQSLEDQDPWE